MSFTQGDHVAVTTIACNRAMSALLVPAEEAPCTRIYDHANNTVVESGTFANVKVSSPHVIEAEVNIDSFKLTLKFNGPVSSVTGDTDPIESRALDVVTTTGGTPGGIDRIEHVPGTSLAILTLDHRVLPTDVDATPSFVRVNCDPAKGDGHTSFIKATGLPSTVTVECGDVPMVDRTKPAILHAGTVDRDGDGFVDGFALEFNEPVNDDSFCMGVNPCPSYFATCNNPSTDPVANCNRRSTRAPCTVTHDDTIFGGGCTKMALQVTGLDPSTPVFFQTGEHVNDRFGLLAWDETFSVPNAPAGVNPRHNFRFTDFVPDILMYQFPEQRIIDDSGADITPQGAVTDVSRIGLFVDLVANSKDVNVMANITSDLVTETDTAPPVVMTAETVDTKLPPNFAEGDGYLDGYKLTFSEPVRDSTFAKTEWHVAGHDVTGYRTGDPTVTTPLSVLINDNVLIVEYNRGAHADTDAKPELTYRPGDGPNSPTGLKDLYANAMPTFTERDVNETDRARPVIVDVTGFPGQDWVTVNMSEPVDNGNAGPLIWDDFFYSNVYRLPDSQDSSGRANGADLDTSHHTPGSKSILLKLNRPLVAGDIRADTVNSVYNHTRETAPSLPPGERQFASTERHIITAGIDNVPPGDLVDFGVDQAATNANSVSLHWIAPGDDRVPRGQPVNAQTAHGPVNDYSIRISTSPFNHTTFDLIQNPTGLAFNFIADRAGNPGLAGPGQLQTLVISGLTPRQTYYFAAEACDDRLMPALPPVIPPGDGCLGHRNIGNATDADLPGATTVMKDDVTPPTGDLTISSTTHRKNTPSLTTVARFNWTALTDPESTVVYYYALAKDPAYEPSPTKDKTNGTTARHWESPPLRDGEYTFSVRGYSGATTGSKTAHYTIIIGNAPLRPEDIQAANMAVYVTASRERGVNTVNWTLPSESQLPGYPISSLESIQIYRLDQGVVKKVYTKPGNYQSLQHGSWQDNTAGASQDSAYRVDMVFAKGQTQSQPDKVLEGFNHVVNLDRAGWPTWVWVLLGIGAALLIVAAVVMLLVVRRRNQQGALKPISTGYVYQPAPAAAVDPATGMPIHDVRCPSCSTEFQAQGQMPLQITCPNCGVSGILQ